MTRSPDPGADSIRVTPRRLDSPERLADPVGRTGMKLGDGRAAVTGGGLVALLDSRRGVVGIWSGVDRLCGAVEITLSGGALEPEGGFHSAGGSWMGTYESARGFRLVERGFLPDVGGGAVFQWTLEPSDTDQLDDRSDGTEALRVRIFGPFQHAHVDVETTVSLEKAATLALVPQGPGETELTERLARLSVRQKQRERRHWPSPGPPFRLLFDGKPVEEMEAALEWIDGARPSTLPGSAVLSGFSGNDVVHLRGSRLAEFGLGALLVGRRTLAFDALRAVAEADDAAADFLYLGAQFALWTSGSGALMAMQGQIVTRIKGLGKTVSRASLPADREILKLLRSSLEPAGNPGLNALVNSHLQSLVPEPVPPERHSGSADAGADGAAVSAARRVRYWVQDRLGAEPDAAYGRLRIAPRLHDPPGHLSVTGLFVGDATVGVDIRRSGSRFSFEFSQESGRVPINLVMAPWLPLVSLAEVRVDGEPAEIEAISDSAGTRVQLQLPLDRPRRVTIVGTA